MKINKNTLKITSFLNKKGFILALLLVLSNSMYSFAGLKPKGEKSKVVYRATKSYGAIGVISGKTIDNPSDNYFTVQLPNKIKTNAKLWLEYELKGLQTNVSVSRQINDRHTTGGLVVSTSKTWSTQRELVLADWFVKGNNTIQFSLPKGADYSYEIKNLRLVAGGTLAEDVVVLKSQKLSTGELYLKGFVAKESISKLLLGTENISLISGEFELLAPSNIEELTVVYKDGRKKQVLIKKEDNILQVDKINTFASVYNTHRFRLTQDKEAVFKTENAILEVSKGGLLAKKKQISIQQLRRIDRVALDFGMSNTTKGAGYRFLPHGIHFKEKTALVKIKYDRTKIPNGYTEEDIRTYYFDESTGHWVALERKSINKKEQYIISETTHFTDMINGVIKTPESPESTAYTPTTMSGIKAANPSAKVNLIQPPSASANGVASVSYPIELPAGRRGMQPGVGLQYNSDGGNGWLGNSWDISIPSISVETRWGVPRYNTDKESETYNLQGAMLVGEEGGETFVAHKDDLVSRKSDRQFYKRLGGGFERIIRKGNSPNSYYWIVTDKGGTKYYYGGVKGVNRDAVLQGKTANGKENIAQWYLVRVEDVLGNTVNYTYEAKSAMPFTGLEAKVVYCKNINYTGYKAKEGAYKVEFIRESSFQRKDKRTNAKYGFLTMVSDELLSDIKVTYDGQKVRSYKFGYKQGAFYKTLLDNVKQFDTRGEEFNSHTFEYYDDVNYETGYSPFKGEESWSTGADEVRAGLTNPLGKSSDFSDAIPALGGGKSSSIGGNVYTGVGPLDVRPSKSLSGGFSYAYSRSTSEGIIAMVDINGDGLGDKVVHSNGKLHYFPNLAKANIDGSVSFGPKTQINGVNDFSVTESSSHSFGLKGYALKVNKGEDQNWSTTTTTTYFSDVNSDGLIDIVKDGKVYFNTVNSRTGVVTFTKDSADTPSKIKGGGKIDISDADVSDNEQKEEIKNNPLQDVVRIWIAPINGKVRIKAPVNLIEPSSSEKNSEAYGLSDGVRVAFQKNKTELWNSILSKGDFSVKPLSLEVDVRKGDQLFFRVQSGVSELSNGSFDKVNWDPEIEYTDKPLGAKDYNGMLIYKSKASEAQFFSSKTQFSIPSTIKSIDLVGSLSKEKTTDSVVLEILNKTTNTVLLTKVYAWDEVLTDQEISLKNISFSNDSENLTELSFSLYSKSSISWDAVKWKPEAVLTSLIDVNGHKEENKKTELVHLSKQIYTDQILVGESFTVKNTLTKAMDFVPQILFKGIDIDEVDKITENPVITVTIKKRNGFVAQFPLKVIATPVAFSKANVILMPFPIRNIKGISKGDELWIEYTTDNAFLGSLVTNAKGVFGEKAIIIENSKEKFIDLLEYTVNPFMYSVKYDLKFGNMNNNWGQFTYNALEGRSSLAINPSLLTLPDDEDDEMDPRTDTLVLMIPNKDRTRFQGNDTYTYIEKGVVSASRLGNKHVVLENPLKGFSGGGVAFGIPKISKGYSNAGQAGYLTANESSSKGNSSMKTDFRDMNGDGYPDILTANTIQYTNSRGEFGGVTSKINGIHSTENESLSFGVGGNMVHSQSPNTAGDKSAKESASTKKTSDQAKNNSSTTGSLGISTNSDETLSTFMDINGDGLADKVIKNMVEINTGYGFLTAVAWGGIEGSNFDRITRGHSSYQNGGLGFDTGASDFSGGIGLNRGDNYSSFSLMDVNSDGLPDKVQTGTVVKVSLNTGVAFESPVEWTGLSDINETSSTSESINGSFTFPIPIAIAGISIKVSSGLNGSKSANRNLATLRDVDGDGYLDYVTSEDSKSMQVKRSTIGNTNRLKTVINPLGGKFDLSYKRTQATYNHPGGKWVLASVRLEDGVTDDGSVVETNFDYEDGKYLRDERTFLGFGKVITKSIDTETKNVYRVAKQEYDVSDYYKQGSLLSSVLEDGDGNLYTKKTNEYKTYSLSPTKDTYTKSETAPIKRKGIVYNPVNYTKTEAFEGTARGVTLQEMAYDYGDYGTIRSYKYSDKGDLKGGSYKYETQIQYKNDLSKYILSLPTSVKVLGSGSLFREVSASYNSKGNITTVNTKLDDKNTATTNLEYDKYGNITKRILPENYKGKRMFYKYIYERDLHMYPERIEDAFGYHTRFEKYDYRFGLALQSEDINGFFITYKLDDKGRVIEVRGPNEEEEGVAYTIKNEYGPLEGLKSQGKVAYATTKHYDPQHKGDDLETVTFMDGMARAIQVKKEAIVAEASSSGGTPTEREVFLVSGRMEYDAFGRAVKSYYPTTEAKGTKTTFNSTFDNITPTTTKYDIQDRAIETRLPDGATTKMTYGLGANNTLKTILSDANGNEKTSYTNGSGLTLKVEEQQGIETNYAYDPINQLLKVTDTGGNEIVSTYDLAGRRTKIVHPDAGTTTLTYDKASNMLSKQTANLKEAKTQINYEYDYGRLTKINYPEHPENNVSYHYGKRNAPLNRVGKLIVQEDGTGAQEFFYGRLGEITKVKRTIVIPNNAVATFETEWKYDSWNRLQEMIYPDKERVQYSYNKGGQLEKVTGKKTHDYNYVEKLAYDKFGQRTYLKYANGAETVYQYDPELRRLENLKSWTGKGHKGGGEVRQFMNNQYKYDQTNNVLSVQNLAPIATGDKVMGGQMEHHYSYDDLYRLTEAKGSYTGTNKKTAKYSLVMEYDNLHNITSKSQHLEQEGVSFDGKLKAGYDLTYNYGAKPHQLETIADENYRTEDKKQKKPIKTENIYQYDANGNLVFVGKNRNGRKKQNERKLLWDEENRLEAISDNGFVSNYTYDGGAERAIKLSGNGEAVYVNSKYSGAQTQTDKYTAYVFPHFVLSTGGKYTKHIYIGSSRIVSKLGDIESFGQDPRRIEYAGEDKVDYKTKYETLQQVIKDRYKKFKVTYRGKDNDDYQGGKLQPRPAKRSGGGLTDDDNIELHQFYYHPDHLGSSSYITNLDGEIAQHIEYVPFGEVFLEEKNNVWNTPYKFNGKELDEETGLSYYSARYYNPRESIFLSVDPLTEKTMTPYAYCYNNPVKYIDPSGMEADDVIINGGNADRAFTELQASVGNRLKLSRKNGRIAYEVQDGATLTKDDKQLTNAIDDHTVTVNIDAQRDNTNSDGSYRVGGSFMGNTYNKKTENVSTKQEINPDVLSRMSNANGKPGRDVLHEVTESYLGGKLSQKLKRSALVATENRVEGNIYDQVHPKAVSQSGPIEKTYTMRSRIQTRGLQPVGLVLSGSYNVNPRNISKTTYSVNGTVIQVREFGD